MKQTMIKFFLLAVALLAFAVPSHAQGNAHVETITQLLPFQVLQPGDEAYLSVGLGSGKSELTPCQAAVKAFDLTTGKPALDPRLQVYCRVGTNGFAGVYVKNDEKQPIAIYSFVRVTLLVTDGSSSGASLLPSGLQSKQ
ncbi:MAG: hypothetical protein ND895_02755 [Pyrinomonadaceae bacterium]|nr:hypothetical protein [Pyrinomonadaceae bacterium]